jgi:nitroreductase
MGKKAMQYIFISLKRSIVISSLLVITISWAHAQELKPIKLMDPDKKRGLPVMEALSLRASVRSWSDKEIGMRDLSDMLWAANGINRPDGRRTAASATNAQDVDVYVFMKEGIYLYDAAGHVLNPVVSGDYRNKLGMPKWIEAPAGAPGGAPPGAGAPPKAGAGTPPGAGAPPKAGPGGPRGGETNAPILIFLVSDISRFRMPPDEVKLQWASIDTGIVYQNIALFCAGVGLSARPRALFNEDQVRDFMKLKGTQHPILNIPVGYAAE